jgi:hypothetical protein
MEPVASVIDPDRTGCSPVPAGPRTAGPDATGAPGRSRRRRRRPPLAAHERTALSATGVVLAGFVLHGVVDDVRGTAEYAVTVMVLAALLYLVRPRVVPAPVAYAAAASATVHLAGGLIRVGDGVLYNATPGPELLRYDHVGHSLGIFVGALLVWELLVREAFAVTRRSSLVVLTTLAALGLGAVNETVEYVATLVHSGSQVGGYTNTGWDLVANLLAGAAAGVVIHRRRHDPPAEMDAPASPVVRLR